MVDRRLTQAEARHRLYEKRLADRVAFYRGQGLTYDQALQASVRDRSKITLPHLKFMDGSARA